MKQRIALVFFVTSAWALAQPSPEALKLHADATVFDAHVHIANRQFAQGGNIGDRYPDGQVDLPRIRQGGVDAFFFTLGIAESYYPGRYETKQTLRLINFAIDQIDSNRETLELARSAADIERITREGRTAAILDVEGGFDMDGDLDVLRGLYRLGLRSLQLPAHNWTNEYADSCCAPPKWNGLNDHGRLVIQEMNRLGMVINISHAADQTIEQALEVSSDPLIATHHGLRHFNDIPRVMPDNLLLKLAEKGGLIGFHIGHSFHSREFFDWKTNRAGAPFWDTSAIEKAVAGMTMAEIDDTLKGRYPSVGPIPPPELRMSVDDWLEVVEYAIDLVGDDHVILGTDFDGGPTPPKGMDDISDLALLTDGMLRRGWSETRIRKFLGGNLLRVFRQIAD